MSARTIIAALGDSLTVGEHADGSPVHNHPWPAYLDAQLFPYCGVGQFGLGGDIVSNMKVRYETFIKGNGFKRVIFWGGINDIIADTSATTIYATMLSLITEILADGLGVDLVLTTGFNLYAGWSAPRQAQLDALRVLMLATPNVNIIDLYQPYPVGMNDPIITNAIYSLFAFSDKLHINPTGALYLGKVIMPARLAPFVPGTPIPPAPVDNVNPNQISVLPGDTRMKVGNREASQFAFFNQIDGSPVDLTGCGVTLSTANRAGVVKVSAGACVVLDPPSSGVVKYPWASGDTDTPATYAAQFLCTFPDGKTQTFPSRGNATVTVEPFVTG